VRTSPPWSGGTWASGACRCAAWPAEHYDHGLLSKVLRGRRPYSEYLAERVDGALGAGGEIVAAARRNTPVPGTSAASAPKARSCGQQ
jgi:hypothetical protein